MLSHALSFSAGVVTGWTARSVFGSTRELAVRVMTATLAVRERVRRTAAEQVEWWEDMVAEARSRFASERTVDGEDGDDDVVSAPH
jgi:hypothetical protein